MPEFSQASFSKLTTCDQRLVDLFMEVIKHFDCTIIEGHRSEEDQLKAFNEGKSKLRRGPHNANPSRAVDVAPYPINWDNIDRFYYFGGWVKGIASQMGIKIRYGGDWDGDTEVKDQGFKDLVHFELIP